MPRSNTRATPLSLVLPLFFFLLLLFSHLQQSDARLPFACDPRNGLTRGLRFCRTNLPMHVRVRDLIGRLTLQEKIRLLVNNAAAVPRLGIGGYEWWSEALHGVSNLGPGTKFGGAFPGATSFPQVITTAASFNASLWEEIGRVSTSCPHNSLPTSYSRADDNIVLVSTISEDSHLVARDFSRAKW